MPRCRNRYCCHKLPGEARFCPRCGTARRGRGSRRWILAIPLFCVVSMMMLSNQTARRGRVVAPTWQGRPVVTSDGRTYPDYGRSHTDPRYPQHADWTADHDR